MEPALDERGDPTSSKPGANATAPQWSPLSTSGATLAGQGYQPARNDRRNGARSRRAGRRATTSTGPVRRCAAAMEPALDERGDSTGNIGATPPSDGRNGARSRRAGRRPAALTTWLPPRWPQWSPLSTSGATLLASQERAMSVPPQWSPLSTSGATGHIGGPFSDGVEAAMEPALDERGDANALSTP